MNIEQGLNPILETLGLLYTMHHREKLKQEMISEICDLGIDGESFYNEHCAIIENYISAFAEKYVPHTGEEFLLINSDKDFFLFLLFCLLEHPQWIEQLPATDEEIIKRLMLILQRSADLPESQSTLLEDNISFIERLGSSDSSKWKFLSILTKPRHWLATLIEIYKSNLPAYQFAFDHHKKLITSLIKMLPTNLNDQFKQVVLEISPESFIKVTPTLIFPLIEIVGEDLCIYGLLNNPLFLYGQESEKNKEILFQQLKAISDRSRMEILRLLRDTPKYNLEIAEHLQLSTATASHHMNILLSIGFVSIKKTEGKVFYHLDQDAINKFFRHLQNQLLYK